MKILWVSNTIFPDLAKSLGENIPVIGGWMYGLALDLVSNGTELTVVTASKHHHKLSKKINGIQYYLLESSTSIYNYDQSLESQWVTVIKETQPDVVHIHGTEAAHGLALMNKIPDLNYVISIQGLISVYTRYYWGGLTESIIKKNITFRDVVRRDSLLKAKQKFKKRGEAVEVPYLKKTAHVIGRTHWDHTHAITINPNIMYHFCNESLRKEFYDSRKWDADSKKDYSLMISSAAYPIKGMHKVLEAIKIVKKLYPEVKLNVVGKDITDSSSFSEKLRLSGYGKLLKNYIRENQLSDQVNFMGSLEAKGMIQAYLNNHAFICPSSIENSPNSLGEAQLLGTPVIASYAGGIPDMVDHESSGLLYRFEEIEQLARHIIRIFEQPELAEKLSKGGIISATKRHDRERNLKDLMSCYTTILENNHS
ncbi:glycosyltransferase family 4 protein [Muricauda sp. 2012CJ35-5]|uniref:Glycosyltransferase family 4 protein n=1 Tax=Flagellimonas spongiicola TaxID=2942208 RepID=A0ABT0PX64_9FLAO|nr:glycosyltransferase family 4 protein [Allomuricauda spongiicola]MCL6275546.1 glycosyltransferase family 4 protein [Allomuricauda spongiicola]